MKDITLPFAVAAAALRALDSVHVAEDDDGSESTVADLELCRDARNQLRPLLVAHRDQLTATSPPPVPTSH